jgi:hypothetical protein
VGVEATIPMFGTSATVKAAGFSLLEVAASFIETALVLVEGPAFGGSLSSSAGVNRTSEELSEYGSGSESALSRLFIGSSE